MSKIIEIRGVGEIFSFPCGEKMYCELVMYSGERKTFPSFVSAVAFARGR
jgi:hypothetical protein